MDDLTQHFADLATSLMGVRTLDETMALIVQSSVEVIDGCDHASLSFRRGSELISASSNDDIGPILDRIQSEEGEGPCLDAIRTASVQELPDMTVPTRFPRYTPRAVAETPVRSSMATPLVAGTQVIGALNLFSNRVLNFRADDDDQSALVAISVAHSTPALAAALEREALQEAIRSRDVIGQAKGILMARSNLDEDGAFDVLRRASQRLNVKLRDVAERIAEGQSLGGEQDGA